jgi:hypothetical protein
MLYPGDVFTTEITTHDAVTGAASDADSLPTAVLVRNAVDTVVVVTVEKKADTTGVYSLTATIPEDWDRGDSIHFLATAAVNSITANAVVLPNILGDEATREEIVIPPSPPGFITGYLQCYDEVGLFAVGVPVQIQMTQVPDVGGLSFNTNVRTETADEDGMVYFTKLVPGATYNIRRGTSTFWQSFSIAAGTTDNIAIDDLLGHDVH